MICLKKLIFLLGFDIETLKIDMVFCGLAYGFIPSEYIGFDLINKSPDERKQFCSDIDMNVFGYNVNNIVEVQKVLNKATSAIKFLNFLNRDFCIINSNSDFDQISLFIKNHPVFVKKKFYSSMGKGVELIDSHELDMGIEV